MKRSIEVLFDELIELQEKKLLKLASSIIPNITSDDILQPNDYPELENHPFFRYEEGVLKGLHSARMALLAEQENY
ncbi:MAG: hypothetical protein KDK76_00225 [Chlamydiia bacterium]|nr:hypothetical protein [Chlamydiia bacterium]